MERVREVCEKKVAHCYQDWDNFVKENELLKEGQNPAESLEYVDYHLDYMKHLMAKFPELQELCEKHTHMFKKDNGLYAALENITAHWVLRDQQQKGFEQAQQHPEPRTLYMHSDFGALALVFRIPEFQAP
eukprot:10735297-Lingulodinium_polyedra.AAC.1